MKTALLASLILLSALDARAADPAPAGTKPLATIPSLDVKRYMGTWYEIAKFPNSFQKKCSGFTTATYSARSDGRVDVVNRCRQSDGSTETANAVARQLGGATSPKLEVRFAPAILSFLPIVWGDYWVIDLDPEYQLAAVSEPKREYLWILSRTPKVDPAVYDALLGRLRAQGLDLNRLVPTRQGE
ncbi:lipocalin family protein [Massilia yuzhufengensis]|uniref:Outer membrane lipoprotein Blc n=1 Tax=Massilia yuzhufengensis TaxID=1164594 RepID=A0A1I1UBQ2_9BURK|nr:lipocalin family protein [Massilia yuzhufengensis]SFD68262.1 apolipoprotein D and lipocalin family protein [Massilia yuzhufengensis]